MIRNVLCLSILLACCALACAQEHRVEPLKQEADKEAISKEIHALLAPEGFQIIRGSSRTVCEIWPCKSWDVSADFEATEQRLYPFRPGQLIGVLHFKRRGKDFRDQTVRSGWYTLRYGLQPTDGNHEGTSPTRDFLLMVGSAQDKAAKPMPLKALLEASAEAAGSTHPAMLCLQPAGKTPPKKPQLRHMEEADWWVLQFTGNAMAGKQAKPLAVDLIVAGHADE